MRPQDQASLRVASGRPVCGVALRLAGGLAQGPEHRRGARRPAFAAEAAASAEWARRVALDTASSSRLASGPFGRNAIPATFSTGC